MQVIPLCCYAQTHIQIQSTCCIQSLSTPQTQRTDSIQHGMCRSVRFPPNSFGRFGRFLAIFSRSSCTQPRKPYGWTQQNEGHPRQPSGRNIFQGPCHTHPQRDAHQPKGIQFRSSQHESVDATTQKQTQKQKSKGKHEKRKEKERMDG